MSRRPARFTEADLRRAAKVAIELGMTVSVTPDGTIILAPAVITPAEASPPEREIVL